MATSAKLCHVEIKSEYRGKTHVPYAVSEPMHWVILVIVGWILIIHRGHCYAKLYAYSD